MCSIIVLLRSIEDPRISIPTLEDEKSFGLYKLSPNTKSPTLDKAGMQKKVTIPHIS